MPNAAQIDVTAEALTMAPSPPSFQRKCLDFIWTLYLLALLVLFGAFKWMLDTWNRITRPKTHTPPGQQQARLVVIGGGYAGTFAALCLQHELDVTLIDTKEYFEFTPSRLRTLVDPSHTVHIQVYHKNILNKTKFVVGKVESLTTDTVHTDTLAIPYDYLVICTGSRYCDPVFPAITAAASSVSSTPQPFPQPTLAHSQSHPPHQPLPGSLSSSLQHQSLLAHATPQLQATTPVVSARVPEIDSYNDALRHAQKILIIGGGTVGVELAAEIIENFPHKQVMIVNSPPTLIHRSPAKAIAHVTNWLLNHGVQLLLGERIAAHEGNRFQTRSGRIVEADLAFMCTGNIPNSEFLKNSSFAGNVNHIGMVKVNDFLQLDGHSNIFVAGDVCDSYVEEKLCQSAAAEVQLIVANLRKLVRGRSLSKYSPSKYPMLISLGRYDCVFTYQDWVLTGLIPAFMKEFVEWKEMVWYWSWSRFDLKYIFGNNQEPNHFSHTTPPHYYPHNNNSTYNHKLAHSKNSDRHLLPYDNNHLHNNSSSNGRLSRSLFVGSKPQWQRSHALNV